MPMTQQELSDLVGKQVADAVAAALAPYQERAKQQGGPGGLFAGSGAQPGEQKGAGEATMNVARVVRALAACKGDAERAASWAKKTWGDGAVSKALGAQDSSAGGFLIPEQWSNEVIEFLRPKTAVRKLGARTIPMPEGSLNIARINTGASAGYVGENTNLPNTQQVFGNVKLTWRKLAALVPISNDLLRSNTVGGGADSIIRDDLVRAIAQAEDLAFIRSDGSAAAPKGLRYWAPSSNVLVTAGATLANIQSDLSNMILALKNANVSFDNPGWIMAPRTEQTLMTITNAQGFYVFRAEMLTGKLWGFPYATTTQIPTNLGGGSNQSELYLVDFSDAVIGEATELLIDTSSEAAYFDGSAVQAAYSLDQTVIRAIERHDFVMRHDPSVAVLTQITY